MFKTHTMIRGLEWVVVSALLSLTTGCTKDKPATESPETRTVAAAPAPEQPVYIQSSRYVEEPPPDTPEVIGYETLSDGNEIGVVTYVHSYPDPIDTYPRVYWAGRWYYNINGDFIYYSNYYGSWCYYYGPPRPLVVVWNWYYPWAPFYWGMGYYGGGYYWGGVSIYGYHAYGLPPYYLHHHHYDRYHHGTKQAHKGTPTGPGKRPSSGTPAGPGKPPVQPGSGGPGKAPARQASGTSHPAGSGRLAAPARDPGGAGSPPARAPSNVSPSHTQVANAPPPRQSTRPNVRQYTTESGQRVTTVSPPPGAPARQSTSLGTVPNRGWSTAPARQPSYRPNVAPRPPAPSAPARMPASQAPPRAPANQKTYRSPRSPPSRQPSSRPTYSPPSRQPTSRPSSSPPARQPSSRPSSPPPARRPSSRPSSPPSRAPSRSTPSRAPSRSAPSRGSGGRRPG